MPYEHQPAHQTPGAGHVDSRYEPPVATDTVDGTPKGELAAGEPIGGCL
ncbi:hypothetical protein [Halorubrum vacuolatum]|uniref:Uncharacterized protein n=1 Tax=Halorubrum vacuolatum TaxID=63740 RepID=A0A238VTZ3_HALVU|nr:hypothetical protein [Halorubrum vacuolatum]SNR37792.1 hypothetical protein SAMN06264855_10479 [Halorubrum vacuolatum]